MQPQRKRRKKPTTAWGLVGAQVALFRGLNGLTQVELANRVTISGELMSSIEQGRRPLLPDLARRLDRVLDTKGVFEVATDNMPEVDRYPVWAEEFMLYERTAVALSSFENQVLPGLLQTENYARAVFRNEIPLLSDAEIEERVAARVERQEILHRAVPVSASFIFSMATLKDRFGGDDVHREQLAHLRACADLPGVTIQVMPEGRTTHAGLSGPFVLLETSEHVHLAYTETQRGSHLISDPDEVSILARKYAMLRSQACNPEETKGLLDSLLGER
ncbi:helix-turn-helix transcriptional regulator [Streptomyces sp. ICBB 8177]|uniref:helix-turn-helix domain-containing protein n=1 Tax=Streptomyces sp. ICBB 8177 TaxID=563922 RepID=UPI000D67A594|nr:helix-turn-helix transcriptional regulator [Streptomyces sp. ICBB 8177]PWI45570.1 transcriptional regulator [Streptomyces sp. ICBB 8177]